MSNLTHEELKNIIDYDSEIGVVTWKIINKIGLKAGDVAGIARHRDGYFTIGVQGKRYLTHRVIWFWMTGEWPKSEIDHINGDKTDNRWSNLRAATRSQNMRNRGPHNDNKSGLKGVHFSKKGNKWIAQIYANNQRKQLGRFDCPAAASLAYQVAASKYHGEFSRIA
jgi:hypothetical protein